MKIRLKDVPIILALLLFIGCQKEPTLSDETMVLDDGLLQTEPPSEITLETPDKVDNTEPEPLWHKPTHVKIAEDALKIIGVSPTGIYEYAGDPDDFTGSADEGLWYHSGKPGHAYFYRPGTPPVNVYWPLPEPPYWADDNVESWFIKAKDSYTPQSPSTAKRRLGYVAHYIGDLANPYHTYDYGLGQQWCDHTDYENWVNDCWTSRHYFRNRYFPVGADSNFINNYYVDYSARQLANTSSYYYNYVGSWFDNDVRDDWPPYENKTLAVAQGTAEALKLGVSAIAGMYIKFCKEVGAYGGYLSYGPYTISQSQNLYFSIWTSDYIHHISVNWNRQSGADIDVYLYDKNWTLLWYSNSYYNNPEYGSYTPPAGSGPYYYIRVRHYSGNSTQFQLNILLINRNHPYL
ncbi:MAG: hypothetical protein ABIL18_07350 [candidate division WOR-3 bacterium]